MNDGTNPVTHGYSGKPLFQKLGLRPGMRCRAMNPPTDYPDLVRGVEGVIFLDAADEADVVHLFCAERAVLEDQYTQALSNISSGGMVWISWPKDLTEDTVREIILPTGWVDVKVCAVDQDWSGLKFMRRQR